MIQSHLCVCEFLLVCFFPLVSSISISLQFETYTAMEVDLMQEVCVFVDGNALPSGRVAQYQIRTVDQTAIGKTMKKYLYTDKFLHKINSSVDT